MINPFEKIDDWLMTYVYEAIAWRTEYHFGVDCFELAKLSWSLAVTIITAKAAFQGNYALIPIFGIALLGMLQVIQRCANFVRISHINGARSMWYLRWLILSIAILSSMNPEMFGKIHEILAQILFVSTFYFMMCNPMPPKWKPKRKTSLAFNES